MTYFPALPDRRKLVMGGQSMNFIPAAPHDVPTRVGRIVGLTADTSAAEGGLGWDALLAPEYLANLEAAVSTDRTILVMNGGQGDILDASGRTAQECYELATIYAETARGYGYWKVVGVAFPGVTNLVYTWLTPQMLQDWADLQALTAADPDGIYDAVVRCDTAPLDDATNMTYFALDQLHLRANGAAVMGDRIGATIITL